LARRARYLAGLRGEAFAEAYNVALLSWLGKRAESGAQLGTALEDDPQVRTFGYAKQATILARFEPETLRVLRVFFKGQDWRRGPR
jgi:hypothetical protein